MEEDTEGLDHLIKQKISRPNYARIISMEFSRDVYKRSSEKKKVQTSDDKSDKQGTAVGDSDDSEYYSAEEFIFSSSSSNISTDDESFSSLDQSQSSDSLFDSFQSSTNSSLFGFDVQSDIATKSSLPQRQRAPTKKQKRKRKKSGNTGYDFSFPLCSLDIFDMEMNELKEEIIERETHVLKSVPSLVDLCVLASKKISKTHSHVNIPKTIKRVLQIGNSAHSFRHQQLDSLFHVLELSNNLFNDENCKQSDNMLTIFARRNVWSLDSGGNSQYIYQGSQTSSYIPYHYDSQMEYNTYMSDSIKEIYEGNRLSALAHTIDLLLPERLSDSKSLRRRHKSNTDSHSAEMDHNVKRIKQLIQNKFTGVLTDHSFSIVLPYVFWARGDVKKASQAFLTIADKDTRVRVKATYLYDAGRMMSQFGDIDSAIRFYHLASDALFTKQKHMQYCDEVDRQTRLLCASANDVGLLSFAKAEKSISTWKSAISFKIPESIQCGGSLAAIDSFLCYFAAYWHEQTGCIYEEAVRHLEPMVEKEHYLNFYLSMVYALNGKGTESNKIYRRFAATVTSDEPLPGQASFGPTSKKTWQPLVDTVIEQGIPPKPMKVVWRVQLVPPRFSDPHHGGGHIYPHEADLRSRKLNLRISNDGYLTGDMQMIMPPMRGMYMDLYTGKLHLTKVPSNTEQWKTFESFSYIYKNGNSQYRNSKGSYHFLPTMTEMYRGHFGETIHVLNPTLHSCVDDIPKDLTFNPNLCHLVWTGGDGQKMKINVYYRFRSYLAERIKTDIKNSKHPDDIQAEMNRLITKFINKGWQITQPQCIELLDYANYNLYKGKKNERKSEKLKGKTDKKKTNVVHKPAVACFDLLTVHDYCVFNRGLAISLFYTDHDDCHMYVMVIDATSKETFTRPKFLHMKCLENFVQQSPTVAAKSDCFCVYCNEGNYMTIDRYGEVIEDKRVLMNQKNGAQMEPVTFHSTMYGLNENKILFGSCNGFYSEIDYLGEMLNMRSVADILVLLTVPGEIKFVDLPSHLPIEPVIMLNKPLDTTIWEENQLKIKNHIQFSMFNVVGEATFTDGSGKTFTRGAVAVDNNLLIIKVQRKPQQTCWNTIEDDAIVTITQSFTLAGFPKEVHFINETVGFLVTVTQHFKTKHHYRENLYHYHHDGHLMGVLMCLGQGPRSFLPVYLTASDEHEFNDPDHGKPGWRVYMRDGHDGIISVLLNR